MFCASQCFSGNFFRLFKRVPWCIDVFYILIPSERYTRLLYPNFKTIRHGNLWYIGNHALLWHFDYRIFLKTGTAAVNKPVLTFEVLRCFSARVLAFYRKTGRRNADCIGAGLSRFYFCGFRIWEAGGVRRPSQKTNYMRFFRAKALSAWTIAMFLEISNTGICPFRQLVRKVNRLFSIV